MTWKMVLSDDEIHHKSGSTINNQKVHGIVQHVHIQMLQLMLNAKYARNHTHPQYGRVHNVPLSIQISQHLAM